MAERKPGCLTIFLFVALCVSVFVNFVLAFAALQRLGGVLPQEEALPRFREIVVQRGSGGSFDKIAVIMLRGLISSSIPGTVGDSMVEDMRAALQQARDDSRVKAIVLEIDSPGGEVTAADAIYNAVTKARARKPVVVYMDSLAASGGYYIACGGKFLMANETTITGSIGVIIQTLNYEQLLNKVGLAAVVFKSGKFKDMLNARRKLIFEKPATAIRLNPRRRKNAAITKTMARMKNRFWTTTSSRNLGGGCETVTNRPNNRKKVSTAATTASGRPNLLGSSAALAGARAFVCRTSAR